MYCVSIQNCMYVLTGNLIKYLWLCKDKQVSLAHLLRFNKTCVATRNLIKYLHISESFKTSGATSIPHMSLVSLIKKWHMTSWHLFLSIFVSYIFLQMVLIKSTWPLKWSICITSTNSWPKSKSHDICDILFFPIILRFEFGSNFVFENIYRSPATINRGYYYFFLKSYASFSLMIDSIPLKTKLERLLIECG